MAELSEASSKPNSVGVAPQSIFRARYRQIWPRRRKNPASASDIARAAPRFFIHSARAERDRWALWLIVGLGCGIGLYFALPSEPPRWLMSAGLGAALAAALLAGRVQHGVWLGLLALAAAMTIGFSAAQLRTQMVDAPILSSKIAYARFTGRIETLHPHKNGIRVVIGDITSERPLKTTTPGRIRISIRYGHEHLRPGDWIKFAASLIPPPDPAAPHDYDFGRWAYYQGMGAVGFALGKPAIIKPPRADKWDETFFARLEILRNDMTAHIRAILPDKNGAIAAAMITGERGSIDPADESAYRDSGLVHILSISGLHLALAGGFFFWIVRASLAAIPFIALHYPIKKWAALAALSGATFYLLISGCEAPAVRSYIMLSMMFIAVLADRPALTMRNVALAAALILLIRPESLIQPGFQMSFAAVVGLIAVAEWQLTRTDEHNGSPGSVFRKFRGYFFGIIIASLIATLATTPIAIFHFERTAQYGALANLISLPIADFVIMPSATLAMLLMPLGLESWPLWLMGQGITFMSMIAHWVASLPGAASVASAWPDHALLTMLAGALWLAIWRMPWRWLGLIGISAGLIMAHYNSRPDLLISDDTRTIALRMPDGKLGFIHPPKDLYSAEIWLRRDGDARDPKQASATAHNGVLCDDYGCIATRNSGQKIAFVSRVEALTEDCAKADLVISAKPVKTSCSATQVIDLFDLLRHGTHAVHLGGKIKIETVEGIRGQRPWSRPQKAAPNSAG